MLEIGGQSRVENQPRFAPNPISEEAKNSLETGGRVPLTDTNQLGVVHETRENHWPNDDAKPIGRSDASGDDAVITPVSTVYDVPHVANNGGQARRDNLELDAPSGEANPLAATVLKLRDQQRLRQFCIVSQSRIDRACEAFVARYLLTDDEKAAEPVQQAKLRKERFKQAQALRKRIEAGGEGQGLHDDQRRHALPILAPVILASAAARDTWDKQRATAEKQMRKLARTLPVWSWVETVAGFGDLGLAVIIGETGDLTNYATKERVWKRLGLAVMDGLRQGSPPKGASAEVWIAHGYNPKRRAEAWAFCSDAMFRHQWRGAKDDKPAHAIGPYGEIYAARKAATAGREGWTDAHRDADARRIMTKAFIEGLWKAWRHGD